MRATMLIGTALAVVLVACEPQDQGQPPDVAVEPTTERAAEATNEFRDVGPDTHLLYLTDAIEWKDGPGSFEEGAEFAVLEGDPAKAEVFTMRIRMPDGFEIAPHWHPNVERVTVISGTFLMGSGEALNKEDAKRLEAGSYTSYPPETRHFAIAEGETVVQLTSVGPWAINYVNPEDDPRTRSN